MGQTLTHGVYLPDEGERNCYAGLASNWSILDGAVGTAAEHTTALAGKAPLVHTHTKSDVTDLLNSNFIPSANNSYDLGSSSYQWNNLYAKNYYYNGVAWGLDKANVWTQSNQFNGSVYSKAQVRAFKLGGFSNDEYTVQPQNTISTGINFVDKNDAIQSYITFQHRADATETHRICFRINRTQGDHYVSVNLNSNDEFYPERNNAIDLGTSNNKWKSLNGVNPGALSLPDVFDSYNVVTTDWNTSYSTPNNLLINGANPSYPGWLYIRIDNCTAEDDFVIVRYYNTNQINLTFFGSLLPRASAYVLCVPIQAGITTKVWVSKIPTTCKYYACLGTVK